MNAQAELHLLLSLTLRDPQAAARRLLALRLSDQVRWLGLALVAVLTLIVMQLTLMTMPQEEVVSFGQIVRNPVTGFVIQTGSIIAVAAAMAFAGRVFGGRGLFPDALLLMVWMEFVLSVIAAIQFVLLLILPLAGLILSLVALGLFVWLLVNFAAALHGFTNLWLVLAGMIGTFFALAIIAALVMAALGIDPQILGV